MNERERALAAGVIAAGMEPELPFVRRLSAASVIMLEMLGNPLSGLPEEGAPVGVYHVAEYVWMHAAELGTVREVVLAHELAPHRTREAVLVWAEQYTEQEMVRMAQAVRREAAAAGDALVVVDHGDAPGN